MNSNNSGSMVLRREQLQQRFRRADVSTRIAAHVQDEAVLRKAFLGDQVGERLRNLLASSTSKLKSRM